MGRFFMEIASTSETSVNFYQATRRNNPEYSHFRFDDCMDDELERKLTQHFPLRVELNENQSV
jgi:hypothetical protein